MIGRRGFVKSVPLENSNFSIAFLCVSIGVLFYTAHAGRADGQGEEQDLVFEHLCAKSVSIVGSTPTAPLI